MGYRADEVKVGFVLLLSLLILAGFILVILGLRIGQPVVTYDARCPASQAYGDLTSEVIARCNASSYDTIQNDTRHVYIQDIAGDAMRGDLT